jgi:hypothetical protein
MRSRSSSLNALLGEEHDRAFHRLSVVCAFDYLGRRADVAVTVE